MLTPSSRVDRNDRFSAINRLNSRTLDRLCRALLVWAVVMIAVVPVLVWFCFVQLGIG